MTTERKEMLTKEIAEFAALLEKNGVILFLSDGKSKLHSFVGGPVKKSTGDLSYYYKPLACPQKVIAHHGNIYQLKSKWDTILAGTVDIRAFADEIAEAEGTVDFHAFVEKVFLRQAFLRPVATGEEFTDSIAAEVEAFSHRCEVLQITSSKTANSGRDTESFRIGTKNAE